MTKRSKLTEALVRTAVCPLGKDSGYLWDSLTPGLALRVRRNGDRRWLVAYNTGGKERRITIGAPPAMTLASARAKAAELAFAAKVGGVDPLAARAERQQRIDRTVGRLLADFLEQRRRDLRPATMKEYRRQLGTYARPLHDLDARDVTRGDVARLLDRIAEAHGDGTANRTRAALSSAFAWAVERDYLEQNPCVGLKRRREAGERNRVLTDAELLAIWQASDPAEAGAFGAIVRLLILTGQRREEIAALAWARSSTSTIRRLPGSSCRPSGPRAIARTRCHCRPRLQRCCSSGATAPDRGGARTCSVPGPGANGRSQVGAGPRRPWTSGSASTTGWCTTCAVP